MTNLPKGSKGFAHILLLVILVVGLVVVVDLVKNQTTFKSKASEGRAVNIPGAPSNLRFNCVNGNLGSFTWNVTPGINSYILSINRIDGNPPDWFPASDGAGTGDRLLKRDTGLGATYASFIEPIDKDKNYSWGVKVNSKDAVYIDGGEFSCGHPTGYMWGSDFDNREFDTSVNMPFTYNVATQSKDDENNNPVKGADSTEYPNLVKIEIYAAKKSDIDNKTNQDFQGGTCLKKGGSWCLVDEKDNHPLNNYNFNGNWIPQQTGDYYMVVNVYDSLNRKCSGNPNLPAGWSKCGTKDSIIVHVTNSSSSSTNPSSSPTPNATSVNITQYLTANLSIADDSYTNSNGYYCYDGKRINCRGQVNKGLNFIAEALDYHPQSPQLQKMEVWVTPTNPQMDYWDDADGCKTISKQWCLIDSYDIGGGFRQQRNVTWIPKKTGLYYVVINAYDKEGDKCSGNPFETPAGWTKCSPPNDLGQVDKVLITVNNYSL